MRLILLDLPGKKRFRFDPLAVCRPIWELRCGMTSLAEQLIAQTAATDVAGFVPEYLADVYRETGRLIVNSPRTLAGDDLLLVNARVRAADFAISPSGPSEIAVDHDGDVLYARIARADLARLESGSIEQLLASARKQLPAATPRIAMWEYAWDLVLANAAQLGRDFVAAGRSGVEGVIEEPRAIRGSDRDVYVAPGAVVQPMVVIDATAGPVYIDEGAQIHPFTRIEGPCYVGRDSVLLGAKCRAGNTIGPVCRIGGEIEHTIVQGYTNKYHDGFLGHAYVGAWVNLGAMTTNSDLKNDYSNVSVVLDGKTPIDTKSQKVGSLIGDHTKTSIGTLLNTGAYVGAMCLIAATGGLIPKYIPSFTWYVRGALTPGAGRQAMYRAATTAMGRRGHAWTDAQRRMWDSIFAKTSQSRERAILRTRERG